MKYKQNNKAPTITDFFLLASCAPYAFNFLEVPPVVIE
jgi:hypothetical protein